MSLQLTIVTPQGQAYHGTVKSVLLPGSEGDFGVLERHERFLSPLRIGAVEIVEEGGHTRHAAIADGFADVSAESVAVLVESCELAEGIDEARAELAHQRAQQGLAQLERDDGAERRAAFEAAIERAKNRIAVSQRAGGSR